MSSLPDDAAPPLATPSEADLRRLTFYALTSSTFTLVPVPLLGDHLLSSLRRRIAREAMAAEGIRLEPPALQSLAGTGGRPATGCILGAALFLTWKISVWILRRLVRTLLFWLALKEAVDQASRTFHEGYLLSCAAPVLSHRLRGRALSAPVGVPAEVIATRLAIAATCRELDPRPLERVLKTTLRASQRTLRRAARALLRRRGEDEPDPAALPGIGDDVVADLSARVAAQASYLSGLTRRLRFHLDHHLSNSVDSSI